MMNIALLVLSSLLAMTATISEVAQSLPESKIAVLSLRDQVIKLKYYRITRTGRPIVLKSAALEELEHNTPYVHLKEAVESPDGRYLACNYHTGTKPYSLVQIYDLRSGKNIQRVVVQAVGGEIVRCAWDNSNTLRYFEQYLSQDKHTEYLDERLYLMHTASYKIIRTIKGNPAVDRADLGGYSLRAKRIARHFVTLHVAPPIGLEQGGIFQWNILGVYGSCSTGAVSDDSKYAVAETYNLEKGAFYIMLESGKVLAEIKKPNGINVRRLKFVGDLLLMLTGQEDRNSIQIWSLHPVRKVSSIDGDVLVD